MKFLITEKQLRLIEDIELKSRAAEQEKESIKFYSDKILKGDIIENEPFPENVIKNLSKEILQKYVDFYVEEMKYDIGGFLDIMEENGFDDEEWVNPVENIFNFLPNNIKNLYVNEKLKREDWLTIEEFKYINDDLKKEYIKNRSILFDDEYDILSDNMKKWYIDYKLSDGELRVSTINGCSPVVIQDNLIVEENTLSGKTAFFDEIFSGNTNLNNLFSNIDENIVSGELIDGDLILNRNNGDTIIITGFTSNIDIYTTGVTISGNTLIFNRNDNNNYQIDLTPIIGGVNTFVTGGTFNNDILTLERNDNVNIHITGFTDFYTTGVTWNGIDTATFERNDGNTYNLTIDNLHIDNFSATTITSGGTLLQTIIQNIVSGSTGSNNITIGTTAIASGTVNRILFEGAGNVVQQNANFRWDNTNNRAILGTEAVADTNSRLVVIGKDTGTNTTFAVHNSTGTNNALVVRDDGLSSFGTTPITGRRLTVNETMSIRHLSVNNGSLTFTDGVSTYGTILANGNNGRINIASGGAGGLATGGVFLRTNNIAPICFTGNNANPFSGTIFLQMFGNTGNVHLQNGGTYTDIPSSILTLNSTEKGFLPPRMTTAQRDAIASPATGLTLYNTSTNTLDIRSSASIWNKFGSETVIIGNGTTSSTFGLQVHNSTGTNNALVVRDDGFVGIGASNPDNGGGRLRVAGDIVASVNSTGILNMGVYTQSGNANERARLTLRAGNSATATIYEITSAPNNWGGAASIVEHVVTPSSGLGGSSSMRFTLGAGSGSFIFRFNQTELMRIRNNSVLIGTSTEAASSILTLESTTRGFLPPRNADPATNITSPAEGLIAFDTTDKKLQVYDGTNWIDLH